MFKEGTRKLNSNKTDLQPYWSLQRVKLVIWPPRQSKFQTLIFKQILFSLLLLSSVITAFAPSKGKSFQYGGRQTKFEQSVTFF